LYSAPVHWGPRPWASGLWGQAQSPGEQDTCTCTEPVTGGAGQVPSEAQVRKHGDVTAWHLFTTHQGQDTHTATSHCPLTLPRCAHPPTDDPHISPPGTRMDKDEHKGTLSGSHVERPTSMDKSMCR
jgi:hypothetical protein